jgi:hypothetical protein
MSLFLRLLHILLGIAFVVLGYYVVIYVLALLGIAVPDQILKVIFVILGLMAVIGALSGKFDNWWLKPLIIIVPLLALSGCAQMFACKTDASYIVRPDGTKEVQYSSCKEQIGLDAKFGDVHVQVDKSGTQESVVAASLQLQIKMLEILGPILQQSATKK